MRKVSFVGAGPGDPELITLKGRRLLDSAEVVVYAGSLVNPALIDGLKAELHDSAGMSLEEITDMLVKSANAGRKTVRLHSGDISFYSAITEQIRILKKAGIGCEVVPGVSSLAAGAAALGQELTVPKVSQTVIVTRAAGRTPVPESESIASLASHGATMVIFLSVGLIEKVMADLLEGGYPAETPVSVIERASWPEERIIEGNIGDIAQKIKDAGIKKTALIYVGRTIGFGKTGGGTSSKLYDRNFSHGARK